MANGLRLQAFDPAAIGQAKLLMPKVVCCESPYRCAEGADALVSARSGTLAKRDGNARCRGPAKHLPAGGAGESGLGLRLRREKRE
jgi:hypothetical protein